MADTTENLRRKIEIAVKLGTVVKSMKAIAASNINQFEMAVGSLEQYYKSVCLGFAAYFTHTGVGVFKSKHDSKENRNRTIVLVVGSDIGLVGQFNEKLIDFSWQSLKNIDGEKGIWSVGEHIQSRFRDAGVSTEKFFNVPGSINYISQLVSEIIIEIEKDHALDGLCIFHNRPNRLGYRQVSQQLLPLGAKWLSEMIAQKWPTQNIPQVAGDLNLTLSALIREYLFVSLFRVCAESLAAENASRLEAMQRAEKNIDEMLEDLRCKYNRMRQDAIDEEIFDVIAGFEALK